MNNIPQKLRLIYGPFLLIALCFVAGYSFLNWLIFIKLQLFSLNEDIINLWLPFALPWIPGLIWIMPRIKLLRLKTKKKSDLPTLYLVVACITVGITTMVAQSYMQTATGRLTGLADISNIDKQPPTKYYSLKQFYIDKTRASAKAKFTVTGKYDQYLDMNLFYVSPVLVSAADTSGGVCKAWMGVKYHKQIRNDIPASEKEGLFKAFAQISQDEFETRDLAEFVYLDRIGNNDDHKGYQAAIKENDLISGPPDLVLVPIDEPFEARSGNNFAWIFGSFAIGAGIWLIMVLIPGIDMAAVKRRQSGKDAKSGDAKDLFFMLFPREGYFITPVIADLNLLIFLIMVFAGLGFMSFDSADLIRWGADYKPAVAAGQWWRLVTNIFLHGGFIHVFANTIGLIFAGLFLEPKMGRGRFTAVYVATGVIASLTSLWWHDATVSIGASGAIFGLYGSLLALILTKVYPKEFGKAFLPSILIFVGYNLVMGLRGSIDNAAHLGGLVSGFLIGLLLSPRLKAETVVS
jgi:membrane associated rhomboid family serine protease